jgi:hypothetical protein
LEVNPMRYQNGLLLTIALLLTACAPASLAQPATAEASAQPQTNQDAPALTNEQVPTIETSSGTSNETSDETLSETPAPPTASAETAIANTPTAANSAPSPAAVAQSSPVEQGAVAQEYENLTSPVDLLASYYNAVNRQEYERAYSYWQEPPNDYDSFAAGYADTAGVQLIVQPPTRIEGAAGSVYVEIPTVLIAQHNDGSTHTFAGCIVTRKSNLHPPDIPEEDVWHLYQALISEVANSSSIPALLAQGCQS